MNPLISIVITAYNYKNYLDECLESCFAQTFKDFEIVLVDDGSTDGTKDICSMPEKRLVVIHHDKNLGYATAKNTGILAARAPYIRMLDADDKLTPIALKAAVDVFDNDSTVDLVHGICLRWYGGNDTRGYNKKTYVHAQGRMWHRSVYDRFGLYYEPLKSMADKEFVYRLGIHPLSPLPKIARDVRINEVVAWYRKHKTQMHRVRKLVKPHLNKEITKTFKRRIKQLAREGITANNTRFR